MKWAFVPSRFLANPVADFLTLFTSMLMHAGWLLLGASGAIAGVLGSYILMFPQQQVRVLVGRVVTPVSALIVIGGWIVLQFFSGKGSIATADTGGVAYIAHIGGFIAGFVLTFLFRGNAAPRLTS